MKLRSLDIGCHINSSFTACLLYADDIILLSPSLAGLQQMLDCCSSCSSDMQLKFNCNKSCCSMFGPLYKHRVVDLSLCDGTLAWVPNMKYLGLNFVSGRSLSIDISYIRRKFYRACNSIYTHSNKQSELTQLFLQESYCLPILTYCTASIRLSCAAMAQLNACWNSVYRRIFGFHKWESVRCFVNGLGRLDLIHLRYNLMVTFYKSLLSPHNRLYNLHEQMLTYDSNFVSISKLLNTSFHCPLSKLKDKIRKCFSETCS